MDDKERNEVSLRNASRLCKCGHPKSVHNRFVNCMFVGCQKPGCFCSKFEFPKLIDPNDVPPSLPVID